MPLACPHSQALQHPDADLLFMTEGLHAPNWHVEADKHDDDLILHIMRCRWYDLVVAAEDDICTIMTVESGKPFKESKGEFVGG